MYYWVVLPLVMRASYEKISLCYYDVIVLVSFFGFGLASRFLGAVVIWHLITLQILAFIAHLLTQRLTYDSFDSDFIRADRID